MKLYKDVKDKIRCLEQSLSVTKKQIASWERVAEHRLGISDSLNKQLSTHQAMLEKMQHALWIISETSADEISQKEAKQALEEYQKMKKGAGNG